MSSSFETITEFQSGGESAAGPFRQSFLLVLFSLLTAACCADNVHLVPLGVFCHGDRQVGAAEIAAHDPLSQRLFVTNGQFRSLDVLDIRNPMKPKLMMRCPIANGRSGPTSVATRHGLVAVAVPAPETNRQGHVVFLDTDGNRLGEIEVGYLPDMVCFAKNGTVLYVANEGEPSPDYACDPPGSVSIINIQRDNEELILSSSEALLTNYPVGDGVRVFGPDAELATNLEPEYIAVGQDTIWVVLQENNALAVIDRHNIDSGRIVSLGFKNHNLANNGLDPSDQDAGIQIRPWNVYGMYQPDSIATFRVGGEDYVITANEGDTRDYEAYQETMMVSELELDKTSFPNREQLVRPENLGRLKVSRAIGDDDDDGDFDRLFAYGGRSFSIWSAGGKLVYDSGDQLERWQSQRISSVFNSNFDVSTYDSRSDDRGPEPEGVTVGWVNGHPYAFLGLERPSAIVAVDLSDPASPRICDLYHGTLHAPDDEPADPLRLDQGPEGLCFIAAEDSPTGEPLLAVAFEESGTTRLFAIRSVADEMTSDDRTTDTEQTP